MKALNFLVNPMLGMAPIVPMLLIGCKGETPDKPSPTFTITASVTGTGGKISPAGAITVRPGGSYTFKAVPDADMLLNDVLVDGLSVATDAIRQAGSYTVANVTKDLTVSFVFKSGKIIQNGDMETADPADATKAANWNLGGWGGAFTGEWRSDGGHSSTHYLRATKSAAGGDTKWWQRAQVEAGKTYIYTAYYRGTGVGSFAYDFQNAAGAHVSWGWGPGFAATADWAKAEVEFTVPADIPNVAVYQGINSGYLDIDDVELRLKQ